MAIFTIPNVVLKGVSACVPSTIERNADSPILTEDEKAKLISSIGVEEKRIGNVDVCTSDLCYEAAETLIADLKWDKKEIDCLVFVSQSPDYIIPATSCILQDRLGLSQECYAMDVSLGCSGWVYGLSSVAALLSAGCMKKALLLAGDTVHMDSPEDKSAWPLFGEAGTATALEYVEGNKGFVFHTATDGSGKDAIIIEDGGNRHPFSVHSLDMYEIENGGGRRNRLQTKLEGMDIFSFAISKVPKSVRKVLEYVGNSTADIDYFLFHQANLYLNDTICKKLKLNVEQVPYSIRKFGNTSSASIPLTMITEISEPLHRKRLKHIACGFGVGLSWATVYFETNNITCSKLVEI
jgi:3-oxoacyl-[acyl-carrier-protein] synthase-3